MTATVRNLLSRIEEHCREHGVAETTFGRRSVNDGKLVARLREGGTITLDTLALIEAALDLPQHAPSDPTATSLNGRAA